LDSNQRLPPCEDENTTTQGVTHSALTPTPSLVCTSVCTSEPENDHADALDAGTPADQDDPLAKLAAALLTLSPADRQRLAAMLVGHQDAGAGEGERGPV
jgi:hypothetical protein